MAYGAGRGRFQRCVPLRFRNVTVSTTDTIAALDRIGAPEELVHWRRWIATREQAWQRCDRPEWLVWLAGADGDPVEAIVAAAVDVVAHVRAGRDLPGAIDAAIEAARAMDDVDACCAAAAACEASLADLDGAAQAAVEGGAWVARAADGVAAARAADEAKRAERGRHLGTMVGIAPHAITPWPDGPLRLERTATAEPRWQLCAYAVAAAAEAVAHAARALAQDRSAQAAHDELTARVRQHLAAAS